MDNVVVVKLYPAKEKVPELIERVDTPLRLAGKL